ncbi:MAG: hypothetical protein LBB62_09450 [Proteiniphilum sp.]|jgi:hypothetical protein|nr:hypothetical protein [Proteiniphilum sp.]
MSKKRNEYIDQLFSDLKLLEERLLSVKESDTLPFSFFSASFDRIEKISRSLHELELMQIGEMKEQMERLVRFLSEQPKHPDPPERPSTETEDIVTAQEKEIEPERAGFTGKIILPEYKDPRISEAVSPSSGARQVPPEKNRQEKPVTRSLNDSVQAPPALLDLKRKISLNDRFLFQRELFNNNRAEMNSVMEKLNALDSFEEAENYLRSEQNWDFENQTVKEFLLIIKKGFE